MDNNLNLISLNFYDDDDNIVESYQKNGIRWGILKKSISIGKTMSTVDEKNFTEDEYNKISTFVCEVFGNKFTTKDLEEKSNFEDVFNVFLAVTKKANSVMGTSPN